MDNNDLILKPIGQLLSESVFIPAYQRGYRWTKLNGDDSEKNVKIIWYQINESVEANAVFAT